MNLESCKMTEESQNSDSIKETKLQLFSAQNSHSSQEEISQSHLISFQLYQLQKKTKKKTDQL